LQRIPQSRLIGSRTTFRRWCWWLPALLLAAGLGYVGYRAMHPPWADTEAWQKYRQVRLSMSKDEVIGIMGSGPHDERWFAERDDAIWWIRDGQVVVSFDNHHHVCRALALIQGHPFEEPTREQPWWDRLRARLGW
jgi:hypothetical protein